MCRGLTDWLQAFCQAVVSYGPNACCVCGGEKEEQLLRCKDCAARCHAACISAQPIPEVRWQYILTLVLYLPPRVFC